MTKRALTFTHYLSLFDKKGRPETASWEEWLPRFSAHALRGSHADGADKAALDRAKNGPCLVLGEIEAGKGHKNVNVLFAHALGLDLDSLTEAQLERVVELLRPYEWAMYTTHKHGAPVCAGAIKVRAILPTAEPLTAPEFKIAWENLQRLVGGLNDEQTKNIGRVYYLPSTFDLSVAWSHRNEGRWISLEDLAAFSAPPRPAAASPDAAALRDLLLKGRPGEELSPLLRAVAEGRPLAEPGRRHAAVLEITMWLARRSATAPFRDETIADAFAASCEATRRRDGEGPEPSEIVTAYRGALEKIDGWRDERRVEDREKAYSKQRGTDQKYTDAELSAIATQAGIPHDPGAAAQALHKRWIVQAGDQSYYILAHDGGYRGPFGSSIGRTAAVEILARSPVLLNEPGPRGMRRRALQELAEDHGAAATGVVVDLTATISRFDEKRRIMFEAARPLRTDLSPAGDEGIAAWLRDFAPTRHEKLSDWMACAPDLAKLLCALYLSGGPSAGKTIFAMGIAQLWADAPANFADAVSGSFNEELLRCPLVLADEDFGQSKWRRQDVTGQIRSMLSTLDRTVTRKYAPPAAMRGAIRLIIAANNDFLLSSKEALSGQDVAAIAQRFLYIRAPAGAAEHLAGVPGEVKERWKREGIARHALWLQQNRVVERGTRFWVEGDVTQMHRLVTLSNDWTSRACEWIVRYLMAPKDYNNRRDGLVRVGKGKIFVNEQAIVDGWSLYFPNTRVEPEISKIGAALRAISGPHRPALRWNGERRRYREIVVDTVFAWSDVNGLGDRERMLRTLWDGEEPPPFHDAEPVFDGIPDEPAINAGDAPS